MKQGFTLIEMLMVIAILGIVFAFGYQSLEEYRILLRIREAQTQFAQDLEQARQISRRLSLNLKVTVDTAAKTYKIFSLKSDGTEDTGLPSIGPKSFPIGIQFSAVNTPSGDPIYSGPFARLKSATANCYAFGVIGRTNFAEVTMLGVTGIVVRRPVQKTGSPCA